MSTTRSQLLILAIAMTTTAWAHSQVPHATRAEMGESFVPKPQTARVLDFGFDALMSDYYWLQAVQIAGGNDFIDRRHASQLGQLVDVVTTLNPHVGHPYRFAAVWLTHDEEQIREGIRLLERATETQPDDWRNYFYLGFNHFFYLSEFESAASALEKAVHLPGRPPYLPRLVARLKSQHSDIDVAEVFLRELLRTTEDEEGRAKIQSGLDEIELEYKARHLDEARALYRERNGRDIASVDDLVSGTRPILKRLPSPEPDAIPESYRRGSVWKIDPDSERIVTSYLGKRYEVHFSGADRAMRASFSEQRQGQSATEGTTGGATDNG